MKIPDRSLLVGLLALGVLWIAPTATAHDSLAPPGAPHRWLPKERWVMQHWIPFDRTVLERELGLNDRELEAFLVDDHHTLAQLARREGVDVDWLADDLVASWGNGVGARRLEVLRDHTMRLLTQGHLAQHVFFHVFHRFGLHPVAQRVFGLSAAHLDVLRKRGFTPLQVARRHGGASRVEMIRVIDRLVRARRDVAVRRGLAWPAEADRFMRRQLASVPCWLRSLIPRQDFGSPYGKALWLHGGDHPLAWPATARERQEDEWRVERGRERLQWTCWPKVPAWHWPRTLASTAASVYPLRCTLWARKVT